MKNLTSLFEKFEKRTVIARKGAHTLSLLSSVNGRVEKAAQFLLREATPESLRRDIASFLPGPAEELLAVVPRFEILQKEFSMAAGSGASVKEELAAKLETLIPFSVEGMAWGLNMEPAGEKMDGLLKAAPEKTVRGLLAFLKEAGLGAASAEVVSEDEALAWGALESGEKGPFLLLDLTAETVTAVFVKDGRLAFSETFEFAGGPALEAGMLPELSLRLLESNVKPQRILLSGDWTDEMKEAVSGHFTSPVSEPAFAAGARGEIPASLYGARFLGRHRFISLLPRDEKLARRAAEKKLLLRRTGTAALFLFILFSFYFSVRLFSLDRAEARVRREMDAVSGPASEARKIASSLGIVHDALASKESLLSFLKYLALEMPSGVELRELRIEDGKFLLRGQTSSYGTVSGAAEVLEKAPALGGVKLRGTRMRKNLSESHLEFEVTGEWRN